jgi:hypothetical protein
MIIYIIIFFSGLVITTNLQIFTPKMMNWESPSNSIPTFFLAYGRKGKEKTNGNALLVMNHDSWSVWNKAAGTHVWIAKELDCISGQHMYHASHGLFGNTLLSLPLVGLDNLMIWSTISWSTTRKGFGICIMWPSAWRITLQIVVAMILEPQ